MQPYQAKFFIYAESESEVAELERVLYDFVNTKREQGVAVRASKLTEALTKYRDNFFVTNFLR